ncbi:MAG TPA: hypothetical protein HA254_04880 [Candidatus Diapherotrites archaeon]|uniref:Uncharacterized protein n=1 Tax=Candidatus Iainarchaeum sp. TaxID=3101447 RepID=A0A7J4IWS0_9ARCH|nr:hypothetical protein [Candidatus Diapherotrites archaeon]
MEVVRMEELSDEKKTELWKAFHSTDLFGAPYTEFSKKLARMKMLQNFYFNDDIFRREIDGLRQKMEKKKVALKAVDKKIDELVAEADYRRYIASFESMKENFEARKKEMAKVEEAFR